MASQYAPKTFIRQVRGALLNRCLRRHGIDLDVNFEIIKPAVVDKIYDLLASLPPHDLQKVEDDFATITELSTSSGTDAILREADRRNLDFSDIFMQARTAHERACWTFLEHPDVFDAALRFEAMDRFGSSRWKRRHVGAAIKPATDSAALEDLKQQLYRTYAKEGRGKFCHIDFYLRAQPTRYCFFAYPQDHAKADMGYSEKGEFQRRSRKSAFEIIFVYRPDDGLLEILAPGGCDQVEAVAGCFCYAILGLPELPPQVSLKLYDLSPLLSSDLSLPVDPADGIHRVELREICLGLRRSNGWKRRLTFATDDRSQSRDSIHEMILQTVRSSGYPLNEVFANSAKLRFIFTGVDNQRPKHLTFSIGSPDRCSLRDNFHDQIARKYLRRWGLSLDPAATTVSGPFRSE